MEGGKLRRRRGKKEPGEGKPERTEDREGNKLASSQQKKIHGHNVTSYSPPINSWPGFKGHVTREHSRELITPCGLRGTLLTN